MPKPREEVALPNPVPSVSLPPVSAGVARALVDAGARGATTLELLAMGFLHPANVVSELRRLGAVIETTYCEAISHSGQKFSGIARYVFRYWNPEANRNNLNYDLNEDV